MSTAMPQIPPRPTRAHEHAAATAAGGSTRDIPKIPPRPIHRRLDRSASPHRESFARSPLNETTFLANHGSQRKSSLYSLTNTSGSELQRTPSNVALPSLGQEGNEYADVFSPQEEVDISPTQTRNIANDLKLHAPKPSLPTSTSKQRVSAVTRTDSGQAAAFGIGKAMSEDREPTTHPLKQKASFASHESNGTERPPSSMESDHGIPEIGQRVPMYPDAGDVQAPSPAPYPTPYTPGIGFHNDGSKPRHHGRRTSGRGFEGPPGSYGLHGHGIIPHDRFEKAYYEKHPELLKKETGQYHGPLGEDRAEWVMSSDDLNKIVRDTASRGAGLGTSPAVMGTPTEQIGFQASEEYASRMSSPRPQSTAYNVAQSNTSQTHMESPLRTENFPAEITGRTELDSTVSERRSTDNAPESETEDEDTIHIDDPDRKFKGIYRMDTHESIEDFGPQSSYSVDEDAIHEEHGYSAPILASDEVAKEPFGFELQPAVSPMHDQRPGAYDESNYHYRSGSASSLSGSRPTSRPGSIHGIMPGMRLATDSTPLEDLDEYEPLFPEEEATGRAPDKRKRHPGDRLSRPEFKNRRFPSQDIWEDTPKSLQYTATVSTPQLPEENEVPATTAKEAEDHEDETPEQAFARRHEELAEKESQDLDNFSTREKRPWAQTAYIGSEVKTDSWQPDPKQCDMKQRFPSRDIWEDTPDSLQLQTTVSRPQSEEKDMLSPPDERPTTGAVVYHQEKAAAGFVLGSEEGRATTGIMAAMKPQVPARPTRSKPEESSERLQPQIPGRPPQRLRQVPPMDPSSPQLPSKPKPQVPARPSKPITRDSSENVPLSKVTSDSSVKSIGSEHGAAAAAKPKPPLPSRPVGSKIAALQGGFMSDLNKRLQLGPQAPKKEEPAPEEQVEEKEKSPLVDARKGRARGPARRAPAKSPAPAPDSVDEKSTALGFSTPTTLWHIDPEENSLHVASHQDEVVPSPKPADVSSTTPVPTTNKAEPIIQDESEVSAGTESVVSPPAAKEDDGAPQIKEDLKETSSADREEEAEPIKTTEELSVAPEKVGEDMTASTSTLKPGAENVVG